MVNNFYALLIDGVVRKITLTQSITASIRDIFIEKAEDLLHDDFEKIEFDGNYNIDADEVLFVNMPLSDNLKEIATNSIGIQELNLNLDKIKALFWYENQKYYFQNFDNRKLLQNKNVLFFDRNTYTKLQENAFVIDNVVNAIYVNERFYFKSYVNANKIFNLMAFYQEATNEEINNFAGHSKIALDSTWFINNTNTTIRKHITLIQKSKILETADTKKVIKKANKFKLKIDLDSSGKIVFPNDKKICRDILIFLNEQYYIGLITGNKYQTNSKRNA